MKPLIRAIAVSAVVLAGAPAVAVAQLSLPATNGTGPAPSGVLTDAPVPAVPPPMPSRTGPSPIPEEMATSPGASLAGPANSTPFSAAPPGLLPNNQEGTSTRDTVGQGGAASNSPNLSR